MSTSIAPERAIPAQDGSLDSAAQAFDSLLSPPESRDTAPASARQPEQRSPKAPKAKAVSAQQVPTAPEQEEETPPAESEPAQTEVPQTEEDASATPQPRTFTVKVDGEDVEVTEDELRNGYSRQQDYTKKTMELAKARKEFEERELSQVRVEREQYKSALGQIEQVLTDLAPQEPNWTQLRQTLSPEGFADAVQAWQENRTRLQAVQAERQRVEDQQREDATKGFTQYVDDQRTKLIEADPDFGDPTKNSALNDDLCTFAMQRGFTADELRQTVDHRLILVLRDAMRYQQAKAKTPTVKNKIEESIVSSGPGGSKANQPHANKLDKAMTRLRQTGRVEDAALAFEQVI